MTGTPSFKRCNLVNIQFIDIKIPDNTAEEMQNYISYIA